MANSRSERHQKRRERKHITVYMYAMFRPTLKAVGMSNTNTQRETITPEWPPSSISRPRPPTKHILCESTHPVRWDLKQPASHPVSHPASQPDRQHCQRAAPSPKLSLHRFRCCRADGGHKPMSVLSSSSPIVWWRETCDCEGCAKALRSNVLGWCERIRVCVRANTNTHTNTNANII